MSSDRLTVRRDTQMPMSRCPTATRYRSWDILSDSREHERRHGATLIQQLSGPFSCDCRVPERGRAYGQTAAGQSWAALLPM